MQTIVVQQEAPPAHAVPVGPAITFGIFIAIVAYLTVAAIKSACNG